MGGLLTLLLMVHVDDTFLVAKNKDLLDMVVNAFVGDCGRRKLGMYLAKSNGCCKEK